MDVVLLVAAGTATALATGLGAIPVSHLGERAEQLRPGLWGLSVGLMAVASIAGLLLPGLREGSAGSVVGVGCGVAFLVLTRLLLSSRDVGFAGLRGAGARRSALVFTVLFAHSLPEGFALGTAYASDTAGLSLFVILAIALQNIPEGAAVAIPMDAAGISRARQFWAAVGSSAPQPAGALVAYVLVSEVTTLLAFSFGFAAGAMLALVGLELAPQALRRGRAVAAVGAGLGALVMLALAWALGP